MAEPTASTLGKDFLTAPAKNIQVKRIDFTDSGLPEYRDRYAVILDNVMSRAECDELLQAAEATTNGEWERAMVNMGGNRQQLFSEVRCCGRIIWDSREVVARIWARIEHLPEVQEITHLRNVPHIFGNGPAKRGEMWKFTRPNERMRFLKYIGGEYFRPHCDGTYETPDKSERSYFTMHLYMNDEGLPDPMALAPMTQDERKAAVRRALVGGATIFHSMDMKREADVMPKTGRILLFQHRNLLHSGDDVVQGTKYTMRTDLMYTFDRMESKTEKRKSG